ncbi:MAG: glycosyltransferase family 2 protein [Balneolaceae bacterium]|nr:glycosyltransferase family 2 protein [Balneolaceae bacterium]
MIFNISFSIIIVTWNALHHLKTFLPSVAATNYSDFEIVIANNNSTDGSMEWIRKHYPECRIVTFDKNFGYAAGNNKAVKYARGEVLVFLNNDVKTDTGWLHGLNRAFTETEASIIQPKIRSFRDPELFEYAGAAGGMIDWLGYPFCRGRIFDHIEKDNGQYDKRTEIFWASGAALSIKKELFLKSGGFDEDFEFHMEEIDLCWRCLKMGHKIMYEPESIVYHLGGGSLPVDSSRKVFYNFRNSLCMLTKNLEKAPLLKIFLRLVLDGIAGVQFLLKGKPKHTLAVIKSHFSYYLMLVDLLQKRKELKRSFTSTTPVYLIHSRLIITDFFLREKKTWQEIKKI